MTLVNVLYDFLKMTVLNVMTDESHLYHSIFLISLFR